MFSLHWESRRDVFRRSSTCERLRFAVDVALCTELSLRSESREVAIVHFA